MYVYNSCKRKWPCGRIKERTKTQNTGKKNYQDAKSCGTSLQQYRNILVKGPWLVQEQRSCGKLSMRYSSYSSAKKQIVLQF